MKIYTAPQSGQLIPENEENGASSPTEHELASKKTYYQWALAPILMTQPMENQSEDSLMLLVRPRGVPR